MGSLRYLNGGKEQQTTEKPETGTTVHYTHHAAGKRSSAVFTCPKCGQHRLEKHFRSAEVLLPVNTFAIENHGHGEDYGSSDSEAASTDHDYDGMKLLWDEEDDDWGNTYECADCGERVDMETWWFNRGE